MFRVSLFLKTTNYAKTQGRIPHLMKKLTEISLREHQ
jgi:hypothetical protein